MKNHTDESWPGPSDYYDDDGCIDDDQEVVATSRRQKKAIFYCHHLPPSDYNEPGLLPSIYDLNVTFYLPQG